MTLTQGRETITDGAGRPRPLPRQLAWQDLEVGLAFHFDIPVYLPEGWRWEPAYRQTLDPAAYHPAKLDTDQWLEAARAAGARYAIFTATHMGGFPQWQSDLYPYGVKQSPWRGGRGDVVGDFVASCRRAGIRPGLYLSTRFNAWWGVSQTRVGYGAGEDAAKQAAYLRTCEAMVAELCSRYGELVELWFDGGVLSPEEGGPDVLPIVDRHQPGLVFYHSPRRAHHRWAGSETGTTGDPCWATMPDVGAQFPPNRRHQHPKEWLELLKHGDPEGSAWVPPMADAPIRGDAGKHEWFWRPDEDHAVYPGEALVSMYYESVGRNANLILGATPNRDGLIPEADMVAYAAFGREIRRRFDRPLAETSGAGAVVELALARPGRVDHVVLMEEIAHGERVRRYAVEGLTAGNRWEKLCEGTSIGHKRIHAFAAVEVAAVRFRAEDWAAPPRLRRLVAYGVG